jgi:hypothetical protein
MKKIAILSAIAISGLLFNNKADAQIRIHLGLNFAPRPVVVAQPAEYIEPTNYDGDEDYYYLPEVDAYYSVPDQCYYYNDGGRWVSAAYLPGAYRNYDWRYARRYEVRAPRPFMHADYYRARYHGVAFNGHWDRGYDRGWNGDNRRFDRNRGEHFDGRFEQNHNFERREGHEHFAQNNFERNDRGNGHRQGRF